MRLVPANGLSKITHGGTWIWPIIRPSNRHRASARQPFGAWGRLFGKGKAMETMNKVVRIGTTRLWGEQVADVFVRIQYDGKKLSLTGVEGPKRNGDALGSCGQIEKPEIEQYAGGWDAESVDRLFTTWAAWHLNDMRAACEHQRAEHWGADEVEVVAYGISSEAHDIRRKAEKEAAMAAIEGRVANLSDAEKFMVAPEWFRDRFTPPGADSFLSGLYDVKKRETKRTGWVRPDEHPDGVLGKPCPACGYEYGSAWLFEDVPSDVIEWLESLPESDKTPPWA